MERVIYNQLVEMELGHWWFTSRQAVLREVLSTFMPEGGRILDIGAGTGANAELLSPYGAVDAVECDAPTCDILKTRADVRTIYQQRWPEQADVPNDTYDVVTFFDSLEHFPDDQEILKIANKCLKPNGYLFIVVPAYQWLFSRHDVLHHHYRRYNRRQLKKVIRTAGFRLERSGYYNTILFPLQAAVRVLEKITRLSFGGYAKPADWLNKLLYSIAASEAPIVKSIDLPFGLSLFAVARKT